jgi:F0F1-type ATP synthase assembly protein I
VQQHKPSGVGEGYRRSGPYMGLGIEFAAAVILCFVFGRWIDGKLESDPYGALIGFLLGTTGAITNLIRSVNRLQGRAERRDEGSETD